MWPEPAELLVVANSARAIAESAVRGGFRVHILDGFCDQDTQALGHCVPVPMLGLGLDTDRLRAEIERLAASGPTLGLVYGAGLESSGDLLSSLPERVQLLGNDAAVLALLADPERLFPLLDALRIPHPETRREPPPAGDPSWLLKACGGSGGLGVQPWRERGARPATPHYFQRRLDGEPLSVLFLADGQDLEVIGFNRLLPANGDADRPFLYGGAIGQATPPEPVTQVVAGWAASLVGALRLRGLNNLDFILHQGQAFLLELNPRPSATMSLYEDQCEGGWIRRHVRACLGDLPDSPTSPADRVYGQRVIYAPDDRTIPAGLHWPDWCRDLPQAGTQVPCGAPLCTVLADSPEADLVESLLDARHLGVLGLISS